MNAAVLLIWAVVGVVLLIIAVRIAILISRVVGRKRTGDEDLSEHYRPRR